MFRMPNRLYICINTNLHKKGELQQQQHHHGYGYGNGYGYEMEGGSEDTANPANLKSFNASSHFRLHHSTIREGVLFFVYLYQQHSYLTYF